MRQIRLAVPIDVQDMMARSGGHERIRPRKAHAQENSYLRKVAQGEVVFG